MEENNLFQDPSKFALDNIDLTKSISDLEKIFENIKYEYKLNSHISRFFKYIDEKKTYIVRIKINDQLSKNKKYNIL